VLVLRGCGPRGYPGLPEVGNMPLPGKVLAAGSGWEQLYRDHVQQADRGAGLDFLSGVRGSAVARESH
jgi:hypothetical protein